MPRRGVSRPGPTVVAIDGPAGSGKSSVARAAAARLGFAFLDTGASYRAVAWHGLETGADLEDPDIVLGLVDSAEVRSALDPAERWVRVGETDVTDAIREPRVSAATTFVARNQAARDRLNEGFRELIAATEPGIVVEGRDITTVVAPDAAARILLTAAPEVRARRRAAELEAAGARADAAEVLRAIAERDARDSAMVDFLAAAPGVVTLDSSELGFDETVDAVVEIVRGLDTPLRGTRPEGVDTPLRGTRPEGVDAPLRGTRPEGVDTPLRGTRPEGPGLDAPASRALDPRDTPLRGYSTDDGTQK